MGQEYEEMDGGSTYMEVDGGGGRGGGNTFQLKENEPYAALYTNDHAYN